MKKLAISRPHFSNSDASVQEAEAFAGDGERVTSPGATAGACGGAFAGERAASWNAGESADVSAREVPRGASGIVIENVCVPL